MKKTMHTLTWLGIFSVAMGFLETSVVVYLRELYYPQGFSFPLTPIKPSVALTEFLREAATLVMLAAIALLAGTSRHMRLAYFIFCFAIWDICYYLFLKMLLGWPASLFTWDILFLIPVPWVGPVLAPVLLCVMMIVLALSIVVLEEAGFYVRIRPLHWILFGTGSLIAIISFTWDYLQYVQHIQGLSSLWNLGSGTDLFMEAPEYVPQHFNWFVFGSGFIPLLAGIGLLIREALHKKRSPVKPATPSAVPASPFADLLDPL